MRKTLRRTWCFRFTALALACSIGLIPALDLALPAVALAAGDGTPSSPAPTDEPPAVLTPKHVRVNKTLPKVPPPDGRVGFSPNPSDEEFLHAGFTEPLVRVGSPGSSLENQALAQAIVAYRRSAGGLTPLEGFLNTYPGSSWRGPLLINLGIVYRYRGQYSKALADWQEAWNLTKTLTDATGRAVADSALGYLADLKSALGKVEDLEALFGEIEGRDVGGSATAKVMQARMGVWQMHNQMYLAVPSIATALDRILLHTQVGYELNPKLRDFHPQKMGVSLTEGWQLALSVGLNLQMAYAEDLAEIPVPSVVHFGVEHYAAIVKRDGDRYLLDDPLIDDLKWMSLDALRDEGSKYFLIPSGVLPPGWRAVAEEEGNVPQGRCGNNGPDLNEVNDTPSAGGGPGGCCESGACAMAAYMFNLLTVNLHIVDTPVGYSPPRGPDIRFRLSYNQREINQPGIFSYSNLGPKWTFDWISYVDDNPEDLTDKAFVYRQGGGLETHTGFDAGTQSYAIEPYHHTQLVRISESPIQYQRRLPDGSIQTFSKADSPLPGVRRKVFLTSWKDPQGNVATLTWDGSFRIVAVTDAIGQVTTLAYEHPTDPLKITKVTDPFGRFATFDYNAQGRLAKITDVITMTSAFIYETADFIKSLTTPYGTTSFSTGDLDGGHIWIEAVDPLGGRERAEYQSGGAPIPPETVVPTGMDTYNVNLDQFNTFYWDKRAMTLGAGDYTKARIIHWLNDPSLDQRFSNTIASERMPLENRVWYQYPTVTYPGNVTQYRQPTAIGRVLDDGSSQVFRYEYGSRGNMTRRVDPVGRTTTYSYDSSDVDLMEVRQVNGQSTDVLQSFTYNSKHRPLTTTDTANQTTTYTYKTDGRVETVVTPPRGGLTGAQRTTTYAYFADNAPVGAGRLQSVTGPSMPPPLPGSPVTSFAYDGYGRVRMVTDPENYVLTYDYDFLDRVTKLTYPDNTYEQTGYNRLDAEHHRDRLGRWSHTLHDALRRVVSTQDAAGRTMTQEWCNCGSLDKVIDANNNATGWERDLQGRVKKETRADGAAWLYTYETTTSRLKDVTDAEAQVKTYTYFRDDKLRQVVYTNAAIPTATVTLDYDTVYDRLQTMTDGVGTTTYTYNPVNPPQLGSGALASVNGPFANDTVFYTYDELGRVATRGLTGAASTFSFDALGRVASQVHPLGTWSYGYDGVTDRLATLTYPNSQTANYTYFGNTGDHRLQQIKHRTPGAAVISQYDYTYDPVGNIATWRQQPPANPAKVYNLGYDPVDELVSARLQTTDPTPTLLKRYSYEYDPAANRTTEQIDDAATSATPNSRNQLISQQPGGALLFRGTLNEIATVAVQTEPATVIPSPAPPTFEGPAHVSGGTTDVEVKATDPSGNPRTNTYRVTASGTTITYDYDDNGNLSSKTEGGTTTTYEWDAENRLTAVKQGANTLATFAYDGQGRRVQKAAGGVTRTYIYDQQSVLEERLTTGPIVRYVQGPGIDRPLAIQDEGGIISYYLADHLGSIVQMTNSAGAVTLSREYDPYGKLLAGSSTTGFAFTGREWDPESGIYYYRARYYDPKIGRFISEDPIGLRGGNNFYSYVHNDPTRFRDPSGLFAAGFGGGASWASIPLPGVMGPIGSSHCVAVIDNHGGFGLLCCTGIGAGYGEAEGVTAELTGLFCPTCNSICDLPGFYVQAQYSASGGGGAGGGGGGSISGSSAVGVASAGVSAGAGGYAGVTGGNCELVTSTTNCEKCP